MTLVDYYEKEHTVVGVSIALESGEIIKVHPDRITTGRKAKLSNNINTLRDMLMEREERNHYRRTASYDGKEVEIVSLDIIVDGKEINTVLTVPMDHKVHHLIMKTSPLEEEDRKEVIKKMKELFEEPSYKDWRVNNILKLYSIKDIAEFWLNDPEDKAWKTKGLGKKTRDKLWDFYLVYAYSYDYLYRGEMNK